MGKLKITDLKKGIYEKELIKIKFDKTDLKDRLPDILEFMKQRRV